MQEILFGLVLFAILAYGAWRFIESRKVIKKPSKLPPHPRRKSKGGDR